MTQPWEAPIVRTPYIHPAVVHLARVIQAGNAWRVTSIYRPEKGNHGKGIALDTAPMEYQRNNFGPATALRLWEVAHTLYPQLAWLSLAEPDHIHIQLYPKNVLGLQYPAVDNRYWDPFTMQEISNV